MFFLIKWWSRELTLKCKLKCYVKPMKDPLGVSPSKGNQGTTWAKEKILDLSGNRTHDLRIRSTFESASSFVSFSEQKNSDNQNLFSIVSYCFCLFSPFAKNPCSITYARTLHTMAPFLKVRNLSHIIGAAQY